MHEIMNITVHFFHRIISYTYIVSCYYGCLLRFQLKLNNMISLIDITKFGNVCSVCMQTTIQHIKAKKLLCGLSNSLRVSPAGIGVGPSRVQRLLYNLIGA
jgi:hypothetical protein